jgi:glycosyltransferase involved in cell wall biosynthesis
MLSILIPTYNYDVNNLVVKLQKQAAASKIIFEIIVIDDASTDKSIVGQNNKINSVTNCRYIKRSENKGRTATRQELAQNAAFNFLLFLDADVFPKYEDFITRFHFKDLNWDLQFGGIAYESQRPHPEEILRWKYGIDRESLTLQEREKDPYLSVNSGAFLIRKEVFLNINSRLNYNSYGLDNLFKQFLQNEKVRVLHIDNPVYHLGLENTTAFIEKSKESVKTTVELEGKGLIETDLRPIQLAYLRIKKLGLLSVFNFIMKSFKALIEKNLKSGNPSLALFDLYRLQYYIELKSRNHA